MSRLRAISTIACLTLLVSPGALAQRSFDLHAAIAAAAPGDVLRVPPGVYDGPFVIDKPLTLIGESRPILDGLGKGDVVDITAPDVSLRGFVIRNTGASLDRENAGVAADNAPRCFIEDNIFENVLFGVYMKESPGSVIRSNVIGAKDLPPARKGDGIRLWRCDDTLVENNTVKGGRDTVLWFCDRLTVRGNTLSGGRYGLHFMYSDDNLIEGNRLTGNSVGAFLMYSHRLTLKSNLFANNRGPSGYGVGLKDMDDVRVLENRFVGNRVGVNLDNSPSSVDAIGDFARNVFAYNDIGVAWLPNVARNRFTDNAFVENIEQLAILGGGRGKAGNDFSVAGVGNFWSGYAGFDLDGDGVGDIPHVERSYFEDLLDRDPRLRLFLMGPAQQAIQMAVRAFPVVQPRVKAVDEAPRIAAANPAAPMLARAGPLGISLAALGLLSLGAGVLALGAFVSATPTKRSRQQRSEPARASERAPADRDIDPDAPMLRVDNLTKRYGDARVVDRVSFAVKPGQAVALWGPNGAGKTTILRCILGLTRWTGAVRVAGLDAKKQGRAARRLIGYVPQEIALFGDLTVAQTLAFFARVRRVAPSEIDRVLREVDLTREQRKRAAALSGGMKRRLALAVALLGDPPILLLDEPTANLDAAGRDAFLRLLRRQVDAGKTALFTTHRASDVAALARRVLELREGRLIGERAPEDLAPQAAQPDLLRLAVAREHLEKALEALRAHGVDATADAGAIHVVAAQGRRAEPLRLLYEAGVRVEDLALHISERNGAEGGA